MIEINVTGQRMTIADGAEFVQNSVNVYECSFTFDSAWDGFAKTAVFRREAGAGDPIEAPMTGTQCTVPRGVLESPGRLRIGVYGVKDDIVYPTVWGPSVYIQPGTPTQGVTEEDIDQTQYTELRGLIQENSDAITTLKNDTMDIDSIQTESSANLLDMRILRKVDGLGATANGYYYATEAEFASAFNASKNGISEGITFDDNTQYILTLTAYTSDTDSSFNGLKIVEVYTNGTTANHKLRFVDYRTPRTQSFLSSPGKTLSKICIEYENSPGAVWYLKDVGIFKRVSATTATYIPHLIAVDSVARADIASLLSRVEELERRLPSS